MVVAACYLFEVDELDVEDEGGVLRDGAGNSASAVTEVRADLHRDALALRHLQYVIISE